MFVLGHIGIGCAIVKPFLPKEQERNIVRAFTETLKEPFGSASALAWVAVGTLLPDVLDKILYYGFAGIGLSETLLDGTRNIGHTLLFAGMFLLFRRTRLLGLGVLTHICLDHLGNFAVHAFVDPGTLVQQFGWSSIRVEGLLWPFKGFNFPPFPHSGAGDHLMQVLKRGDVVIGELVGLAIIWRDYKALH